MSDASVRFQTKAVLAAITRPGNTDQYTAGDVVAAADDSHLEFAKALRPGPSSGSIGSARIFSSANQGTKPDLELWLFYEDITQQGDNAAWAPTDAELQKCVGVIDFAQGNWRVGNAGSGASGNAMCETNNIGLSVKGGKGTLYGVLVERGTYTPVSAETFTVQLVITQD